MRASLLALALALSGAVALAGCGGFKLRPPPPIGAQRTINLAGRVPLQIVLPPGYELQRERGPTFDVINVWRVPPRPLGQDTSLSILIGQPQASYCRPQDGHFEPGAFRSWRARWHVCGEPLTPGYTWETHVKGDAPEPLHIFIIGADPGEHARLRRIAEGLVLR